MSKLLCPFAYRESKRGKIYCKQSGIVCAHQYWCDMAVEFKQYPDALQCPGREENHGEDS